MLTEKKRTAGFLRLMLIFASFLMFAVFAAGVFSAGISANAAGETAYSNATAALSREGKLSLSVTVDKDALDSYLKEADEFEAYVRSIVKSVNSSSKDSDMVTLKSIDDKGSCYIVKVKTRRINGNMKGMGDFAWEKMSKYTAPESDTYTRLALMYNGNLKCTLAKPYGPLIGSVEIESGTAKNEVYIRPVEAGTGRELTVEEFSEAGAKASDDTYLTMFRLPDMKSIRKITVDLPGKVKYISSECVKAVDKDTIEITPVTLKTNVIRQEYVLDENGNRTYDEAGVSITRNVIEKDKELSCMFGYVVYELYPNYALIGCFIALGALLVGFVVLGIVKKWFAKFFGIQPKEKGKKHPEGGSVGFSDGGAAVLEAALSAGASAEITTAKAVPLKAPAAVSCTFAKIKKHKLLYLMLLPSAILAVIFCYVPMFGIVIAFKDYNLIDGFAGSEWVGLKYFKYIFSGSDPNIFLVFRNTIYIALIRVATNFPAILIFALLINEIKSDRLKGLTRTISYLPNFISWIAVGGMMIALFSVDEGMLNKLLTAFSGREVRINWYAEDKYWWGILALSSMWKSLGWGTIIYMSALGCINSELYDACRIDGGGRLRMILTVTLPGIMNVVMLQLIMDAGNLIRDNYEQILAMTQGSSALTNTTYVVGAMAYSAVMGGSGYSQATAFNLVQGLIGLALVILTNNIAKKTDNEGVM